MFSLYVFEPYIQPITTWFVLILFCGAEYRAYFLNNVIIFLNVILILYILYQKSIKIMLLKFHIYLIFVFVSTSAENEIKIDISWYIKI